MSGFGRRSFSAAMFGFAITAAFISYQLITDGQSPVPRDSAFMILFVVLCPPSLLSIVFDPDVGSNGFYLLWTLIALMNAGLYATTRLLLFKRLQRPD
jgi:hypothetical protein